MNKCKFVDIKPLLGLVRGYPLIPKRGTKPFKQYCKLYEKLIKSVPNTGGIYIWVGPACDRIHRYIGISEEGLQNRFDDEFWQEYTAQWETEHGEAPTVSLACQHYPKWTHKITSQSYRGKAGTTFIVYHELPGWSEPKLRELEAEFIKYFDPVANVDRPEPSGYLHDTAMELANVFEEAIRDFNANDDRGVRAST
ncbi:MAG: hypothetical protein HY033_03720 [Ignavibacteriae bacterium]|nr:hypothetical protein [Ignavibacteria bacterium]MBI3363999.1 hypothetical protein [Ignavibacteriota bacterium]